MAKIHEWDQAEWDRWVAERPPVVQELCRRFPPNTLYRMKSTGERVTMLGYNEKGTVTVAVSGQYNQVVFERNVFGVPPDDLEECDFPGPDEPLGTLLTENEDIEAFVEHAKAFMRKMVH